MTPEEVRLAQMTTLDPTEAHKESAERVAAIAKEFADGFEFLESFPKSVTFFGSAQSKEGEFYYEKARELSGRVVKELGYSVVSGGGPGIMEAADRGAYEAGGTSIGLLIELPDAQPVNKYIKKSLSFYYFFSRKVCLAYGAEVFVFFPGGFGTLDEFFEMITLIQTKKVAGIPLICFGSEFWGKLKTFMEAEMLARDFITQGDSKLFTVTDSLDEIIEIIKKTPVMNEMSFDLTKHHVK